MPKNLSDRKVPIDKLRWQLDPAKLAFETTENLEPLKEIIGQKRGVEALRFGISMGKPGYNVFVTGTPGTGRLSTVKRMLEDISREKATVPDDLCYINNFNKTEEPILLRLKAGAGRRFKKEVRDFVESIKKEVPEVFGSPEYLNRKKEIMEEYENKGKSFFKDVEKKVQEEGLTVVNLDMGGMKRPEVMPLVDGNPVPLEQLEDTVEKGRFPKEEYEKLKEKRDRLKKEIDQLFFEVRALQKELREVVNNMDRLMFMKMAKEMAEPIKTKYQSKTIDKFFNDMLEDMLEHPHMFAPQAQQQQTPGGPGMPPGIDPFQPYQVNLFVDNGDEKGPPVITESYPTYRNLFGSIERIVDRSGVWRTDFSKISAGSFVKANGGFLVLNLMDALTEPGVWPALKRSLKSRKIEIQTYDPFYLFTTTGLAPEPVDMDVKVVVISDNYVYSLLRAYDEDVSKIFKVRADFDSAMDRNEESVLQLAQFVKTRTDKDGLKPLSRTAVAALVEHAVRMTGRQEKVSTSFPAISDLIREADFWAREDNQPVIQDKHVDQAIEARIFRSNLIEERIQEMINRGSLFIDVDGEVVGQINGLTVFSLGDYMFGKPARITVSTAMGRAGIINIEREADMSGNTHNKGILILGGYLRKKYAQDKPLRMSASIAFEQSYGGIDGDSASSTEIYALLSSLSGVPLKQSIAVTGSVNQKGEIQAIGGANQKIEGFYDCCRNLGLTGNQGVMIPESNTKDLMLRKDVVEAVKEGKFHVYSVKTIDEGIEILTGKEAGEMRPDGTYPEGTINGLVNEKLKELAEGLKEFAAGEEKEEKGNGKGKKEKKTS